MVSTFSINQSNDRVTDIRQCLRYAATTPNSSRTSNQALTKRLTTRLTSIELLAMATTKYRRWRLSCLSHRLLRHLAPILPKMLRMKRNELHKI